MSSKTMKEVIWLWFENLIKQLEGRSFDLKYLPFFIALAVIYLAESLSDGLNNIAEEVRKK